MQISLSRAELVDLETLLRCKPPKEYNGYFINPFESSAAARSHSCSPKQSDKSPAHSTNTWSLTESTLYLVWWSFRPLRCGSCGATKQWFASLEGEYKCGQCCVIAGGSTLPREVIEDLPDDDEDGGGGGGGGPMQSRPGNKCLGEMSGDHEHHGSSGSGGNISKSLVEICEGLLKLLIRVNQTILAFRKREVQHHPAHAAVIVPATSFPDILRICVGLLQVFWPCGGDDENAIKTSNMPSFSGASAATGGGGGFGAATSSSASSSTLLAVTQAACLFVAIDVVHPTLVPFPLFQCAIRGVPRSAMADDHNQHHQQQHQQQGWLLSQAQFYQFPASTNTSTTTHNSASTSISHDGIGVHVDWGDVVFILRNVGLLTQENNLSSACSSEGKLKHFICKLLQPSHSVFTPRVHVPNVLWSASHNSQLTALLGKLLATVQEQQQQQQQHEYDGGASSSSICGLLSPDHTTGLLLIALALCSSDDSIFPPGMEQAHNLFAHPPTAAHKKAKSSPTLSPCASPPPSPTPHPHPHPQQHHIHHRSQVLQALAEVNPLAADMIQVVAARAFLVEPLEVIEMLIDHRFLTAIERAYPPSNDSDDNTLGGSGCEAEVAAPSYSQAATAAVPLKTATEKITRAVRLLRRTYDQTLVEEIRSGAFSLPLSRRLTPANELNPWTAIYHALHSSDRLPLLRILRDAALNPHKLREKEGRDMCAFTQCVLRSHGSCARHVMRYGIRVTDDRQRMMKGTYFCSFATQSATLYCSLTGVKTIMFHSSSSSALGANAAAAAGGGTNRNAEREGRRMVSIFHSDISGTSGGAPDHSIVVSAGTSTDSASATTSLQEIQFEATPRILLSFESDATKILLECVTAGIRSSIWNMVSHQQATLSLVRRRIRNNQTHAKSILSNIQQLSNMVPTSDSTLTNLLPTASAGAGAAAAASSTQQQQQLSRSGSKLDGHCEIIYNSLRPFFLPQQNHSQAHQQLHRLARDSSSSQQLAAAAAGQHAKRRQQHHFVHSLLFSLPDAQAMIYASALQAQQQQQRQDDNTLGGAPAVTAATGGGATAPATATAKRSRSNDATPQGAAASSSAATNSRQQHQYPSSTSSSTSPPPLSLRSFTLEESRDVLTQMIKGTMKANSN